MHLSVAFIGCLDSLIRGSCESSILRIGDHLDAKLARFGDGVIRGSVIDNNDSHFRCELRERSEAFPNDILRVIRDDYRSGASQAYNLQ